MSTNYLITVSEASTLVSDLSDLSDQPAVRGRRYELPKAKNFVEKSLSEDTRRAYTRALLDFFSFVRKLPAQVTVEDVIAYRDDLVKKKRRKARTVNIHSDGDDAFIFQPIVNYRTLEFDKALSARHICQIVNRWADFAGLNQNPDKGAPDRLGSRKKPKLRLKLSPHDLRRTAVTRALSLGFTYRQVQSMTGHKDIRMVVKYDHERGNLEDNAINFLHYDDD